MLGPDAALHRHFEDFAPHALGFRAPRHLAAHGIGPRFANPGRPGDFSEAEIPQDGLDDPPDRLGFRLPTLSTAALAHRGLECSRKTMPVGIFG